MQKFFYERFAIKHGNKVFSEIKQLIKTEFKSENNLVFDSIYLDYVFCIALFDYWELNNRQMTKLFENKEIPDVSVDYIRSIHKKSISVIIKYIKEITEKNL